MKDRTSPTDRELAELAAQGRRALQDVDDAALERIWANVRAEVDTPSGAAVPAPRRSREPPARQRRSRPASRVPSWMASAVAAAIVLVVGVGLGLALGGDDGPDRPVAIASVALAPLPGADAEPVVAMLREGSGTRTVEVDLSGLPEPDGFHEVWLLAPDVSALVSLGPARPDGVYVIPDGIDLVDLPVVDVSVEPDDGDPTHSGQSVLRGEVTLTG